VSNRKKSKGKKLGFIIGEGLTQLRNMFDSEFTTLKNNSDIRGKEPVDLLIIINFSDGHTHFVLPDDTNVCFDMLDGLSKQLGTEIVDVGSVSSDPVPDLVYCSECKYLEKKSEEEDFIFDKIYENPRCSHPNNKVVFKGDWYERGKPLEKGKYARLPSHINKDNNCSWFKPKWITGEGKVIEEGENCSPLKGDKGE